jgi:nitrate/nitrite-specific signal transduction histidine kinase
MTIEDNGRALEVFDGPTRADHEAGPHFGRARMRERAESVGASLEIAMRGHGREVDPRPALG